MQKKNPPSRALKYSELYKKLIKLALQELVILKKEDSLNEKQLMLLEELISAATLYAKFSEEEIRKILRSKDDIFSYETIWDMFLKSDSDQKIIIIRQLISGEMKTSNELTISELIEVAFQGDNFTDQQRKRLDKLTSNLFHTFNDAHYYRK